MPRVQLHQNLINHVAFVIDGSGSMYPHEKDVIKVMDDLVGFLKSKSHEMNQETRVTMYLFGSQVHPFCYDVDVLRSPSLQRTYNSGLGQTALLDATTQAVNDLKQTATLYGDHAFLLYVLTDGQENCSRTNTEHIRSLLFPLTEEWTIAALVPNQGGIDAATRYGFPPHNVVTWNTGAGGMLEAGRKIEQATTNYFTARAQGVRGTKNLFEMNTQFLEPATIRSTLNKVDESRIKTFVVDQPNEVIRDAVSTRFGSYRLGSTYYQLTKSEEIQPQKAIIVRDKATGDLYAGSVARQLLGLPHTHTRVAPVKHPKYDIFVQSTSPNRKLVGGTTAIVL